MNKTELIQQIAADTGVPVTKTTEVFNSVVNSIIIALSRGEIVALQGFGTFSVRHRVARKGKHVLTGAIIDIPEANVPRFKPSPSLKAKMQRGS